MNDNRNKTLLQRIRKLETLTQSETKIAIFLENHYPLTAFETISSMSKKADVGKATVGRFITRLGYKNFAEFMESIQVEMIARLDSPTERYSKKRKQSECKDDQLALHVSHAINNMQETLQRTDIKDFYRAAEIMATCKGRLFVTGAATSQALAHYFQLLASYLRKDVYLVDANVGTLAHQLADVCDADVLFAMTHQRFAKVTIDISRWFSRRNAKIILLSDHEVTPVSCFAEIQLTSYSNAPLMFSSRSSSFLLLEALIAAMTVALDPQVQERFQVFDEFFSELNPFQTNQPLHNRTKDPSVDDRLHK